MKDGVPGRRKDYSCNKLKCEGVWIQNGNPRQELVLELREWTRTVSAAS